MAKKNFYAIKNTGEIYTSWPECQTDLKQVKSPVFKGFATKEEALAFINDQEDDLLPRESIFVDGSFNAKKQLVGGSFVVVKDNQSIHEHKFCNADDEIIALHNVGGELLATGYALQYAVKSGMEEVTICHDYQGIASWADGSWQAKKDVTKRYANFVKKLVKENDLTVKFKKISAHTGVKFNERADQLAKEACGIN